MNTSTTRRASGVLARWRALAVAVAATCVVAALAAGGLAQGTDSEGHPTLNGFGVFAAWDPAAGRGASGGYAAEDHPNLAGWDYRINVPYVCFNPTSPPARSGAAMVGVVEDTVNAAATLQNAVHVNNSIWLFAVDVDGVLRFKVLPSRRSATPAVVDNVDSLSTGWNPVGPAGPRFRFEKPRRRPRHRIAGCASCWRKTTTTPARC